MSDINELISVLTPNEQLSFIGYLNARNKRKDTNNIRLFKAIAKGTELTLKQQLGTNNYNVLQHRLKERLIDFISGNTLSNDVGTELQIIKEIVLARKLLAFGKHELALKILHRSESTALDIQHYSLLNEIYHTLIEYSYVSGSQDQHILFQKLERNNLLFINQEKLNMVYATIRKRYEELEYGSGSVDLQSILELEYKKLNIQEELGYSFQVLHQLAALADIFGERTNNYYQVELFFEVRLHLLQGGKTDVEKNLKYHIELIYLLANIHFRKKDFASCAMYLAQMHLQMSRFNKRYYYEHYIKYSLLQTLNLNFTGNADQALDILENPSFNKYDNGELFQLKLAHVMILFQQERVEEAKGIISKFNRTDSWYESTVGLKWVLNKNFIEILIHIELGHDDLVESRIKSFMRKNANRFHLGKKSRELQFLKLVDSYYLHPEKFSFSRFEHLLDANIGYKSHEQEDLFFMCYYAWLRAKIENKPVYTTTLSIISAQN